MQTMVPLYGFGGVPYSAVRKAAPHNLLDNSNFRNPVNQRGATSYATNGYTIDRWLITPNIELDVNTDDISVTINKASTSIFAKALSQKIPDIDKLEKITGVFYVKSMTGRLLYRLRFTDDNGSFVASSSNLELSTGINVVNADVPENATMLWFQIGNAADTEAGTTFVLDRAALYEGEYTAETLPEYQPKGYTAELLECRRYYRKIDAGNYFFGIATGSNKTASFMVPHEQKMRETPNGVPSVTPSDDFSIVVYTQTGYSTVAPNTAPYGVVTKENIVCIANTDHVMNIQATFSDGGLASENNTLIVVRIRTGYLDISADL